MLSIAGPIALLVARGGVPKRDGRCELERLLSA
jgi:hypothetical protein